MKVYPPSCGPLPRHQKGPSNIQKSKSFLWWHPLEMLISRWSLKLIWWVRVPFRWRRLIVKRHNSHASWRCLMCAPPRTSNIGPEIEAFTVLTNYTWGYTGALYRYASWHKKFKFKSCAAGLCLLILDISLFSISPIFVIILLVNMFNLTSTPQ